MNKIERAIKHFTKVADNLAASEAGCGVVNMLQDEMIAMCGIAIQALQKQTPKKSSCDHTRENCDRLEMPGLRY